MSQHRVTAHYEGEDMSISYEGIEFYLEPTLNDPGHSEVENIRVLSVEVFGEQVEFDELPGELRNAINAKAHELEWDRD